MARFARKTACFLQKKCNRKGVFFQKIATERVLFRRPRWHTRVQKLGKCPPRGDNVHGIAPPSVHLSVRKRSHGTWFWHVQQRATTPIASLQPDALL